MCLIFSFNGSPLYNLNNYIPNTLKTYVKDENSNAESWAMFFNYIRNVPVEDDKIMASFGVTSLYKSILKIDMLT